jgi:hypothetical protein
MNTPVKFWVLGVYLLIAVVISGGVYYYKVYHMKVSPQECMNTYGSIAILPESKELVAQACNTMAKPINATDLTGERKMAICILRDPTKLSAPDLKNLMAYIDPCFPK